MAALKEASQTNDHHSSSPHGGGSGEEEETLALQNEEKMSLLASQEDDCATADDEQEKSKRHWEEDEAESEEKELEDSEEEDEDPLLRAGNVSLLRDCASQIRSFGRSYRSTNPQKRVTPFAVVLLLVLLSLYVLNQADRLVLAVLIPSGLRCSDNLTNVTEDSSCPAASSNSSQPIYTTDCIHFDDQEQGILTGPAFVIVYVLAGLPMAYLADTRSRPLVLLVGIGVWSVVVLLTGFVNKFWELLLLRILLGVGEASFNPVAYSLMADFFPVRNRASVFAVYNYGVYFGGSFGWMSGAINGALDWRWTFRLLGIVGLSMLPLAMLALWEPKRIRERRKKRLRGKSYYTVWEVFKYLIRCPPYLLLIVAGSIRNIPGYALGYWLPTYYSRVFKVGSHDYGPKVAFVVLFGGAIGCFLGGVLSDWLSRHRQGAKAFVIAASQLLAAPAIIGVLMVNSPSASYGLLFIAYITAETWLGPAAALVQDITLPAMRAQASAVYIGVISVVASAGPVLVPFFLDHVPSFSDCIGLRYAMICTVPTFYFVSAILFASLGAVTKCWVQKHRNQSGSYAVFTDAIASAPDQHGDNTSSSSQSTSPSSEW